MSIDPVHDLWHQKEAEPLWAESYLSYTYSPQADVGTWVHLAHLPGNPDLWEEVLVISLPSDEYLVARTIAPARLDDAIDIAAVRWNVDEPFARCSIDYRGGARLMTGEELRTGPMTDGHTIGIDLSYTTVAASPPYDYGKKIIGQSWGTGHIEQHETMTGRLRFAGRSIDLAGIAWRDHSWGPRDFRKYGHHVFFNAHFPESGRSLMAVRLTDCAPGTPLTLAVMSDGTTTTPVTIRHMPSADELAQERGSYELEIESADGPGVITADIGRPFWVAFVGTSEVCVGTHRGTGASHDWVPYFSRFTWDGDVGYGCVERSHDIR